MDVGNIFYHSYELHLISALEIQLNQTKYSVPQIYVFGIFGMLVESRNLMVIYLNENSEIFLYFESNLNVFTI